MIEVFYKNLHNSISTSDLPAYKYYSEEFTYRDLYGYMKKINFHIAPYKQKRIVLYGGKSVYMYAAIYSIILSGNTWIPFPLGYPDNRLLEMLEVLDADIMIYEEDIPQALIEFAKGKDIILWKLGELIEEPEEREFEEFKFSKDDIAYIMFTSGSTGIPKGVPMTHENYINFVNNAMEILPFKKGEIFSDYHDFAFDISIFYLFCAPLTQSALSPIKKNEELIFPVAHFQKNQITVLSSVPSVISRIQKLRTNDIIENDFHILFICGEPFRLDALKYCYDNLSVPYVYNFYGLTETGVENFYYPCSKEDLVKYEQKGFVPIGTPLKGNDIMVTDDHELLISGCQVTPMYLGGIESQRFELIDGVRWYHTGDIVEKCADFYFCKGRIDSQVKLSGYRIELMDIEAQVRRFEGIKEAVCFLDDRTYAKFLLCVCEVNEGTLMQAQNLKNYLNYLLPEYMIPKKFFFVHDMPCNTNGKLDRKKIREMYLAGVIG